MRLDNLHLVRGAPVPLATQLSQQLAWLIASGEIEAGEKLPSVRILAEQLGINFHTVRAAYSLLEAEGQVITRHGVGTIVIPVESRSKGTYRAHVRSFSIGVILPSFGPYFAPMLRGIKDGIGDDPSMFFTCDTRDQPGAAQKYLDQLSAKDVDGIIVLSQSIPGLSPAAPEGSPSSHRMPMVFTDNPDAPEPLILFDLEDAGFQATNHLLNHGYETVAIITPPVEWNIIEPLYNGYKIAHHWANAAIDPHLHVTVDDFTIDSGFQGASSLLDRTLTPRAIFAASDRLAIGALRAIKSRDLRVPEDIALLGINDLELAAVVDPPLSTISLPAHEMGVQAISMLKKMIAGQPVDQEHLILDVQPILRSSCGC